METDWQMLMDDALDQMLTLKAAAIVKLDTVTVPVSDQLGEDNP
jgi:hypothetical protein